MIVGIGLMFSGKDAWAQVRESDPIRFLVWLGNDTRAIPQALLHTSPVKLSLGATSVWAISRFDGTLSRESETWKNRELMRVVEELGDANAVRPLAFVIFAGSLFTDNHRLQDAAFTSVESLIFANMLTNALKLAFGRERPWQGDNPSVFKPFSGNTSFPSGHATTALAAVTPWILYYPRSAAIVAVIVATGTAVSRVPFQFHWPSDVVAGAMIGISTSAWLYQRHTKGETKSAVQFNVSPSSIQLRYQW